MILLQILDEGTITDSQGRKVDFKVCLTSLSDTDVFESFFIQNTIICLTSNIGTFPFVFPVCSLILYPL